MPFLLWDVHFYDEPDWFAMACSGFPADAYDRYVLGLLEEPERSQLEAQIQDQCPDCIRSVQRSMNLWLVFATTRENQPTAPHY